MATQYLFDLYDLFVNTIFGNVFLAIVALGLILLIILMITKSSMSFIIIWMAFYVGVMMTFYYGPAVLTLGFIGAATFFSYAIIRLFGRING